MCYTVLKNLVNIDDVHFLNLHVLGWFDLHDLILIIFHVMF